MDTPAAAPAPNGAVARSDRYPAGIPYIVGNEGAERFSFYGMKAILYVYLVALFTRFIPEADLAPDLLGAAEARATEVTHLFVAGVYIFPLIGAVLADRLLGKYRVIFWVSLIYCAGHGVLAIAGRLGETGEFGPAEIAMFIGLGLIAVGSGGIKPCVSANVGDQFSDKNKHLVTKIFQIFYFIINFGSFFSTILTPALYLTVGPEVAFGVPGILMAIATFVFWLGRKRFVHVAPNPGGRLGLLDLASTVLLFAPFFALLFGYFVMWPEVEAARDAATAAGEAYGFSDIALYYLPLLVVTGGAFVVGYLLFLVRQRIKRDDGFLATFVWAFKNRRLRKPGDGFFDPARREFGEEIGEGPPAVMRVVLVFSMVMVFWALFDQHASTWIAQAQVMDLGLVVPEALGWTTVFTVGFLALYGGTWLMLHVSNVAVPRVYSKAALAVSALALLVAGVVDLVTGNTWALELHAAQLSALNPLMVMFIIPLLNVAVWNPLRRRGFEMRPLYKMAIGMFLAVVAFLVAAILQQIIEAGEPGEVHGLWQFWQYLIITTAEVLVSITGLEFAYTQAPRRMKSILMGFWLLFVALGNLIVAFLAPLRETYSLSEFFFLFAGLMAIAAVIFTVQAYFYKGKSYMQKGSDDEELEEKLA